jgi:hypothetical protein
LSALAREHTEEALATLLDIAAKGEDERARVQAAIAILDGGYGRPPQAVAHAFFPTGPEGQITRIERVIIDPEEAWNRLTAAMDSIAAEKARGTPEGCPAPLRLVAEEGAGLLRVDG